MLFSEPHQGRESYDIASKDGCVQLSIVHREKGNEGKMDLWEQILFTGLMVVQKMEYTTSSLRFLNQQVLYFFIVYFWRQKEYSNCLHRT